MSKLRYSEIKSKTKEFLALTSLTPDEFELVVPPFEQAFQAHMSQWRLDGKPRSQRCYTTYTNCPLPTPAERLLFVLSYVKGNPIQSNHGVLFGMGQGKTNSWLHTLLPVLCATFRQLELAPARSVSELALRLGVALPSESEAKPEADAPLPLFAMMAQNGALSAPKMPQHRRRALAARNTRTP
jgi:Helix-turn-helix of DDE superfamily endonuclease